MLKATPRKEVALSPGKKGRGEGRSGQQATGFVTMPKQSRSRDSELIMGTVRQ